MTICSICTLWVYMYGHTSLPHNSLALNPVHLSHVTCTCTPFIHVFLTWILVNSIDLSSLHVTPLPSSGSSPPRYASSCPTRPLIACIALCIDLDVHNHKHHSSTHVYEGIHILTTWYMFVLTPTRSGLQQN